MFSYCEQYRGGAGVTINEIKRQRKGKKIKTLCLFKKKNQYIRYHKRKITKFIYLFKNKEKERDEIFVFLSIIDLIIFK
jgi:protoheme ferro-lyase